VLTIVRNLVLSGLVVLWLSASPQGQIYICPMHVDVQSTVSAGCTKCGMRMVRVSTGNITYSCPRHPGVESRNPGNCWRCEEPLVLLASLPVYRVEQKLTPKNPASGRKLELRFRILDPETNKTVDDLHLVHEKPFHLFLIDQSLSVYQHLHPAAQPDGTWKVETVLPLEGQYHVFCDFLPVGGSPQLVRTSIVTAGRSASQDRKGPALIVPSQNLTTVANGVKFELVLDPSRPASARQVALAYRLSDARTGEPVTDLEPYLGAWGHTVLLSHDARDYVHSHPRVAVTRRRDNAEVRNEPEILFDAFFPRPGPYRIWSQFQRRGVLTTVSFDIQVARRENIAIWNGRNWSALSTSMNADLNGPVRALVTADSTLYAAGDFTRAGDSSALHIAKWDGKKWVALGKGLNGRVWALAAHGRELYAGGEFTMAGGKPANRIAKWDGERWSALGAGVDGCKDLSCAPAVYALAVHGDRLYAGGRFSKAGDSSANGIAMWDGRQWLPFGSGLSIGDYDGVVHALAIGDESLYAGGMFRSAGGTAANNIARWDGHAWHALGTGVGGGLERVLSLALKGEELYVGGNFTVAGNVKVANAALWSNGHWSAPDVQARGPIHDILVNGSDVHWAGAAGTMGDATVLAAQDDQIYAGGGPFILADP
jgi:hypothetical protein